MVYYECCVLNYNNSLRNASILPFNGKLKDPDAPRIFPESFSQNNLDSGVFYSWWLAAVCHAVLLNDP